MKLRSPVEQGLLCCLLMTTLERNEILSTSLEREARSITLLKVVRAIEGDIETFADSGRAEKMLPAGSIASVASILERSFKSADAV